MIRTLALAALLLLGLSLASAGPRWTQPLAFAQEAPAPDEEMPPAAEEQTPPAADEAPPPAQNQLPADPLQTVPRPPTFDPNVPWWQWRSEDVGFLGALAYQQFWERRTEVLGNPSFEAELDLGNVMAGEPLQADLDYIHTLEQKGQALEVKVQNQPVVTYRDDDQIVVYDTYIDRSYLVNARTREPVEDPNPAPKSTSMAYLMRRVPNERLPQYKFWKVVDSIRIVN